MPGLHKPIKDPIKCEERTARREVALSRALAWCSQALRASLGIPAPPNPVLAGTSQICNLWVLLFNCLFKNLYPSEFLKNNLCPSLTSPAQREFAQGIASPLPCTHRSDQQSSLGASFLLFS